MFCSRIFNTPTRDISNYSWKPHRERERRRRRREHPCRGVSILCSTCGIVQLHSIVAPPSTTTGVGLSNINHHLADFKAEEEEEEAKSAFLSRRSATKASTSFCKLCSFWTNHSAVNAPATANPAWSCGSVVGSSVFGVRSRRIIVSPMSGEREASKTQKICGIHFISATKDDDDEDDEKEKRTVKQRHFPQSARVHLRTHADEGADESCRRREEHSSWRSLHVRRRATRTNARASTF